jgi:hypothetical protein
MMMTMVMYLVFGSAQDCGKPSAFPRIHEKKDGVMVIKEKL